MPRADSQSLRPSTRSLVIATLVALPGAAWWVIGDQTDSSIRGDMSDHMVQPLPLSGHEERVMGAITVAIVVGCGAALAMRGRREGWDRRWLRPLGAASAAGVLTAYGWRVVTAGVIGANIGGGLMVMFGGPLVLILLGWSITRAVALTRTEPFPTQ